MSFAGKIVHGAANGAMTIIQAARQIIQREDPEGDRVPRRGRTVAGVSVNEDTALVVSAVWACLRYLSQTVAMLPWRVMVETDAGSKPARSHPVDYLLHKRPNRHWGALQFRETLVHWALRYGNGYAEIERDGAGRPVALWPVHPTRVRVEREGNGDLTYCVLQDDGSRVDVPFMDMFHLRGFGESEVGLSVMTYAAESIGWARAAQLFGAAFLGQGMNVAGVVTVAPKTKQPAIERMRGLFKKLYQGVRGEKVMFLDDGAKFQPIAIEPDKAQFIATNQHLVEEVCRWFGVPPHKIAHLLRSTNNNIEHQGIEVVTDSIQPWVTRLEQEADFKLFGANRPGYMTRINMNALLRGDAAARAAFYKVMREVGAFDVDTILSLEDMALIGEAKGGKVRIVPINFTTLERMAKGQPLPEPPTPPAKPATDPPAEDDDALAELRRLAAAPPPPTQHPTREQRGLAELLQMEVELAD